MTAGVRLLQLRLMHPNSPAISHLASLEILAIQHFPPSLEPATGNAQDFSFCQLHPGVPIPYILCFYIFCQGRTLCCSRVFSEPATGNALDKSLTPPYNGVVLELTHVYEHIKSSKTGIFFAGVNILTLSRIKVSCLVFRAEFLPI